MLMRRSLLNLKAASEPALQGASKTVLRGASDAALKAEASLKAALQGASKTVLRGASDAALKAEASLKVASEAVLNGASDVTAKVQASLKAMSKAALKAEASLKGPSDEASLKEPLLKEGSDAPSEPTLADVQKIIIPSAPGIAENIPLPTAKENESDDISANRRGAPDGARLSPNSSAVSIFQGNGFDIEANRADGSGQNYRKVPLWEWIFVVSNLIVELPSAVFDQLSSPHKPLYVLMAMAFSLLALVLCVVELLYKGVKEGITFKCPRGKIPWFYYPSRSQNHKPFGTFADLIGLVSAISQCIVAAINSDFALRAANSPIKFSLLPIIFALGLLCSRVLETVAKKASGRQDR